MRMRGAARTGTGWGSDLGRRQGNRAGIAATFAFTLGGRLSTSDASARLALTMRPRHSHGKLAVVSNTDGRVELGAFPGTIRAAPRQGDRHERLAHCCVDSRCCRRPLAGDIFAGRLAGNGALTALAPLASMQPRSITHAWQLASAKIDLPRIRFHDLRHAHATHMLSNGIHPNVASERLGHSRVGITLDLYSHVLPGMQADAPSRVDEALHQALERRASKGIR